jgi:hypothetical protein
MKLKPFHFIVGTGLMCIIMAGLVHARQHEATNAGCPAMRTESTVVERVNQTDLIDLSPVNHMIKGI